MLAPIAGGDIFEIGSREVGGHRFEVGRFHEDECVFVGTHNNEFFAFRELHGCPRFSRNNNLPLFAERSYPQKLFIACFIHIW
jgi:hypothetical protein